jgi:periplasmic protein TonB
MMIVRNLRWSSASLVLLVVPGSVTAMGSIAGNLARGSHPQQSAASAPMGRFLVAPDVMAGRCTTQVSPHYPAGVVQASASSTVVVRVVVSQSGKVTPMRLISGDPAFATEAMNAVRLWRYRPFVRDQAPMDVTTDVAVDFVVGKPAGMVTHPHA